MCSRRVALPVLAHRKERVLDRVRRRASRDLHHVGVVEHVVGQVADLLGHRRREQQVLPVLGQRLQDAADVGQEAHVEHVVGLVEHEGLDVAQVDEALPHQVQEATRARDHHLGVPAQGLGLGPLGDPAEEQRGLQLRELREEPDLGLDLGGQLAGRRDDQGAGPGAALVEELVQEGQREGRGLAGTGLGQAQDVGALQRRRNRLGLDRPGLLEPGRADAALQVRVELETVEAVSGVGCRSRHVDAVLPRVGAKCALGAGFGSPGHTTVVGGEEGAARSGRRSCCSPRPGRLARARWDGV